MINHVFDKLPDFINMDQYYFENILHQLFSNYIPHFAHRWIGKGRCMPG